MSKLRFRVVETAFKKKPVAVAAPTERPSEYYAKYVFNKEKMFRYEEMGTRNGCYPLDPLVPPID